METNSETDNNVPKSNTTDKSVRNNIPDRKSGYAWIIISYIIVAFVGGIFSDIISHGFILPGREGHEALAVIGSCLIVGGCLWYWLSVSLVRRFSPPRTGVMALVKDKVASIDKVKTVECLYYNEEIPIEICRKCGRCLK